MQGDGGRRIYGVGELLAGLRHLLEDRVGRVWVAGEIGNLFRAASGHLYFTLKDADGQLRAALFRTAARRVPFELQDGLEVLAYGDATVYEARGELQLVVRQIEPRGQGALQLALDQLRRRLAAEGLFDADRKRPLPERPRCIGVVTSTRGAALRDILHVSARRFPAARLLISPTRVQGEGAEAEIARALDRLSPRDDVDVVILARGGGSMEDLWAFNGEAVVRAIARARVPVVSGVGHETDVTLADLAADARAPTPSAAAALVLPDRRAVARELASAVGRLVAATRRGCELRRARLDRERDALRALAPSARLSAWRARLSAARGALGHRWQMARLHRLSRLAAARSRLSAAPPAVERRRWRADSATRGLIAAGRRLAPLHASKLAELAARLDALSPLGVVARGYGLVRRAPDGRIVRDAGDVRVGDRLRIRVARAAIDAAVERVEAREEPDL